MGSKSGMDTASAAINRALSNFNKLAIYGTNWSVDTAAQSSVVGGNNPVVGTSTSLIWDLPGVSGEVMLKTTDGNLIDTVSGSNAGDTGHTLEIRGAAFDANGDLVRSVQTVTTNGRTKVTLEKPLSRIMSILETDTDALLGDFYVYEDTAVSGGVPTDLTKVHGYVDGALGVASSQKCQIFTAGDEALVMMGGLFSVNKKTSAVASFTLQVRPVDSDTWQIAIGTLTLSSLGTPSMVVDLPVKSVVPPNFDIRIVCDSSSGSTPVAGTIMGHFAKQA